MRQINLFLANNKGTQTPGRALNALNSVTDPQPGLQKRGEVMELPHNLNQRTPHLSSGDRERESSRILESPDGTASECCW